ncbi:NAD-dependent epimerase/dehydratase family protein [Vibrio renipiscarius]|uniref:NAD-dependent epimerase/dehydratase family protein n=1 Tax=Vibrio renipiscarius TaxID=1461322 RepID=UPI00354B93C5
MKMLLTGSSGFIGRHLNSQGRDFRCVVREKVKQANKDVFIIDKFDSSTSWSGAFTDINTIIHLAGLAHSNSFIAQDYQSVNVDGTLHLASEAAKSGVKRFVFVSSIGVNGSLTNGTLFTFNSNPSPHNPYTQSKYDAEIGLKKISQETGLEVVIVRPTLVYGANAPGNFGILAKLVNKLPLLPFGLTANKRDFIAVHNLADLLITCANHPNAGGHTFLASDGDSVSIKEFTNAIGKGLGKTIVQLPVPVSLMNLVASLVGKSAMAGQLLGNLQVDSSNVQDVLDWVPPYTMEQAMASLSENKK